MKRGRKSHLHFFYEDHYSIYGNLCFYCSGVAECIDHCPPLTLMMYYPTAPKILVKACNECNRILSARPLPTLISRLELLIKKYRKRYAKILTLPQWEHEEIAELSGSLKQYISDKQDSKKYAIAKLSYMKALLTELLGE